MPKIKETTPEYVLRKLVKAVETYFKILNTHPMTEKLYTKGKKTEVELNTAIQLAKEILDK